MLLVETHLQADQQHLRLTHLQHLKQYIIQTLTHPQTAQQRLYLIQQRHLRQPTTQVVLHPHLEAPHQHLIQKSKLYLILLLYLIQLRPTIHNMVPIEQQVEQLHLPLTHRI